MNGPTLFLIFTMALTVVILTYKWSLHFQFLRVKNKKKPGNWKDFFLRTFPYKKDPQWWRESFLQFPLLYPVIFTGIESQDHYLQKIKRTNIVLYFLLIVLLLAGIYISKSAELPQ